MQRPGYSLPTAAEFTDYSKWERKPSSKSETSGGWSIGRVRGEVTGSKRLQGRRQDALSHAAGLSQDSVLVTCAPDNVQKLHSRCHGSSTSKKLSSLYSPPRSVKRSKGSPDGKITKAQAVLPPKLALLQMQIEAKRKSIKEFMKFKEDLLAANLELIDIIREGEDIENCAVQELLEKYRKSRGSVAALKKKTHRDQKELLAELEKTRQQVLKKNEDLREEVRDTEVLLQTKVKERDILKGFKEKEYMVNQVTIEQLRDEIKEHAQDCEENITALDAEISEEKEKYQRMMCEKRKEIEARATEECICIMKRSVKEKGIQNKIMEKEIILHCHKAEDMKESIGDLRVKIRELILALREDRARRNPLLIVEKCQPDTELHLNIPVWDFLPLTQS